MANGGGHRSKRNTLRNCACVRVLEFACVKATHQIVFCWHGVPWKQRRYSSTFSSEGTQIECVTYSRERSGPGINAKVKMCASQMVMVETSVCCEFPATVPCLRPLDYFLGWGATTFQRALSAHVCDLVLLRGLYFRRETHRHPKTKLKVTISQTDHSVLCFGCSGAVKTGTFSSITLLTFERVFWSRRLNLQWEFYSGKLLAPTAESHKEKLLQQWLGLCPPRGCFSGKVQESSAEWEITWAWCHIVNTEEDIGKSTKRHTEMAFLNVILNRK